MENFVGAPTGIEPASPAFRAGVLTTTPQHPGTKCIKFASSNHPWQMVLQSNLLVPIIHGVQQLTTWQEINEDIPEFARYYELIEELKKNKDIKGLQRFLADHILPVILKKDDQNVRKVITLLNERYGRTRTEKVEEAIEDLFKFREDQYEDDDELMLAMS